MRRKLSLPLRLAILVAGTSLPLIGFSAAIVYQHYKQDQQDAFGRVLQITRSIQLVLDREMQGIVSGLTVLAGSDSLARDDFNTFRGRVQGFLSQFPGHASIIVADREGRRSSIPARNPAPCCRRARIAKTAMRFSRHANRLFRSCLLVLSPSVRS